MGMIAAVTPLRRSIPRAQVTSLDVAIVGRVQIQQGREFRNVKYDISKAVGLQVSGLL